MFAETCARLGLDPQQEIERQSFQGRAISESADLTRIKRLPCRDWREGIGGRYGTTKEIVDLMSRVYGRSEGAKLKPQQAIALAELHDFGGGLVPIRVGGGKTLITLLAPLVTDVSALLLVPARLREKTLRDWHRLRNGRYENGSAYPAGAWRLPDIRIGDQEILRSGSETGIVLRVESYERIARRGDDLLAEAAPGLILADEAHALANRRSATWRAINRYRKQRPQTRGLFLSGTLSSRSIKDWAHLAEWALGQMSPLPLNMGQVLAWASYLDDAVVSRPQPGALVQLVPAEDQESLLRDPLTTIRKAFGKRVIMTPGVVSLQDDGPACSLALRSRHVRTTSTELTRALAGLREHWELPDGQPCADAVQRWRHIRELACGFYYRWTKQPPDEWLQARRNWCSWAREVTGRNRSGIDTEARAFTSCAAPYRLAEADHAIRQSGHDPEKLEWARDMVRAAWDNAGRPNSWLVAEERAPRLTIENCARTRTELLQHEENRAQSELVKHVVTRLRYRGVKPLTSGGIWEEWNRVKDSFDPVTEAIWIDDAVILDTAQWLEEERGIVWTSFRTIGEELHRVTGHPFFHQRMRSSGGKHIEDHAGQPAICSIASCGEGANLQSWHKNYVLTPPASGKIWEQLLGRTHRDGQQQDTVYCEVAVVVREHLETMAAAIENAHYLETTLQQPQKLIYGDIEIAGPAKPGPVF